MSATATVPASTRVGRPVGGRALAGLDGLLRLIFRRDRVLLPAWIYVLGLYPASLAWSTKRLYDTHAEQLRLFHSINGNPGELALRGPVYVASVGGITSWSIGASSIVITGLVSMLMVIRYTRAEEQAGRRELLGSTVEGRHAPLAAALIIVTGVNLIVAGLNIGVLCFLGLPAAGSVAQAFSTAGVGIVFAGVAAVCAQVTEKASTARGIAGTVLGAGFVLRAAGDTAGNGLSWVSPLGWARLIRAYSVERWWVLLLFAALAAVLYTTAHVLLAHRDLGTGLIAPRPGPARAGTGLRGPITLSWRRGRLTALSWVLAFAVLGVLLGLVAGSVGSQLDTPAFRRLAGGQDPNSFFFSLLIYVFAQVVSGYAILTVLRLRGDETDKLAEPLLAAAVTRVRWAAGPLLIALFGTSVLLVVLGTGAGLAYGIDQHDVAGQLPEVLRATVEYIPACLLLGAVAFALFALVPKVSVYTSWGLLGALFLADMLGEAKVISDSALRWVSPFKRSVAPTAIDLVVMSALVVALTLVGLVGLRRRDLD